MAQITYENKVKINDNPSIPNINKVTDDDMNEIKDVVNENYDELSELKQTTVYSTEEHVVGMWGDKTLYEKTIIGNLGSTSVAHGVTNADFKLPHGHYKSGNNTFPIPNVRPGYPDYNIGCYVTPTEVVFDKGTGLGQNNEFEIVLNYTKTTD